MRLSSAAIVTSPELGLLVPIIVLPLGIILLLLDHAQHSYCAMIMCKRDIQCLIALIIFMLYIVQLSENNRKKKDFCVKILHEPVGYLCSIILEMTIFLNISLEQLNILIAQRATA